MIKNYLQSVMDEEIDMTLLSLQISRQILTELNTESKSQYLTSWG